MRQHGWRWGSSRTLRFLHVHISFSWKRFRAFIQRAQFIESIQSDINSTKKTDTMPLAQLKFCESFAIGAIAPRVAGSPSQTGFP